MRWAGFALAVLLSGCLARPPQPAEVLQQALPEGTTVPAAWSTATSPDVVTNDWLASFGDPELDAVVTEAIANNPDLRQAAAKVEIAQQIVVVVGSRLKPQIGARIGAASTRDLGEDDTFNSNLEYAGLVWEIDVWGRLRSQQAAAEQSAEATALDYDFARLSLAATTARSWYQVTEAGRLLAVAEQSVQIYTALLDLVRVRRDAGKVAEFDVVQASAALASAQSELRGAQEVYTEARRALELLLGRYPAAEIEARGDFVPAPPPVRAGLPSSLLERRPDLVAAERQVVAAFRREEAAKLALLPSIALTLDGGRLSDNLLSLLGLNPTLLHGVIGMEVPIYEGGRLRARIQIATAEQAGAVAGYGAAALQAFGEVETALTNEALFAERLQYDQAALADRTDAVRLAKIRYTAGASDLLTVLILQTAQLRSEADVIQLRNAQLANRINLHLALGGSF
jgi:NodT family efflux transporter outer membrane factor (OMF) lipoprotein